MTTIDPPVQTGIAGLDQLLCGGLTRNRMYLIEGRPGTGKTTLAAQFLLHGRDRGESTVYVTLSETTAELHGVAVSHGWSFDGVEVVQLAASESWKSEDQYTLFHPAEVELGQTIKAILEVVDRTRATRVVLDSLSELKLLAGDPLRYRRQILALKEYFSGRECTVLMLDDFSTGSGDLQLESLAHGVILLEQLPFDYGRARRRIRIVKLRGVAVVEGFHDFAIRRGGLCVFPQLVVESVTSADSTPIRSGLPELDQLLGGGLTWGTTTLSIGPAGAGKSTLAAQYAAAVAADGKTASLFLFDERMPIFIKRCDQLGMGMSALVAAGRVRLEQVEPGEWSPGEFSHRVRDAVDKDGARLVMIDSLNGYLNAIPQSESPMARMHELLSFLGSRDAATILVVAQHGIVGTSMGTPIDVSYLADCVVLHRFFEAFGSVRRAISIVKKRTGSHEPTIRELQLGPDRIRVGAALSDFQGVLTGVPRYTGGTTPLLQDGN